MQCIFQNGEMESIQGPAEMFASIFSSLFLFPMFPKGCRDEPNRRRAGRPEESGRTKLAGSAGARCELLIAEYRPGEEARAACRNHRVQAWKLAEEAWLFHPAPSNLPVLEDSLRFFCTEMKTSPFKRSVEDKSSGNNDRLQWCRGRQAGFHLAQQQP